MSQNAHPGMVLIVGRGLVAEAVAERYARLNPGRPFVPLIVLDGPERPPPEPLPVPVCAPETWRAPEAWPDSERKRHPNPHHRFGHPTR